MSEKQMENDVQPAPAPEPPAPAPPAPEPPAPESGGKKPIISDDRVLREVKQQRRLLTRVIKEQRRTRRVEPEPEPEPEPRAGQDVRPAASNGGNIFGAAVRKWREISARPSRS